MNDLLIKYIEMSAHPGGMSKLTIVVDEYAPKVAQILGEMKRDKDYMLSIKRKTHCRSLTANAYYWVLLEQVASSLGVTKEEVHRQMLKDYGSFAKDEDGGLVLFIVEHDKSPRGFAPYSYKVAERIYNDKHFDVYAVLKGSHEMNSKEFSELLDGLISEAKEMGIRTVNKRDLIYEDSNSNKTGN